MKYRVICTIGFCILGTIFWGNTAKASPVAGAFESRTAGAASVLDMQTSVNDILQKAGAAVILDKAGELGKLLWGYQNLGIANVDNHLNIRETPADDGKLVGKLSKDAACEILGFEEKWTHIKSGKVEGYVSKDFLYLGDAAEEKGREIVKTMATVTTETLKVRGEPNTDSEVITLVPNGEVLEVVKEENDWVEIMLDDESAFISSEFVTLEQKLDTAVTMTELLYGNGVSNVKVDLCQYAKQFVGNRYVWGGTSLTKGADCSGFVLSVFRQYGVSLPHSSRAQAGYGRKVKPSEAQPGDLFFYAKGGSINHVAIYIGNGQVIHASSPRTGIKISNAAYRTPHVVRRILN